MIHHPQHYVMGRSIEPIEVIESWGLCHHLACVLKYIARCGRKDSALNDLRKAHWYLSRKLELGIAQIPGTNIYKTSCEPYISLSSVLRDWQLSPGLAFVLSMIKPIQLADIGRTNLKNALIMLAAEIRQREAINNDPRNSNKYQPNKRGEKA